MSAIVIDHARWSRDRSHRRDVVRQVERAGRRGERLSVSVRCNCTPSCADAAGILGLVQGELFALLGRRNAPVTDVRTAVGAG